MTRIISTVLLGSVLLGGCQDPEAAQKIEALENRIAELEKAAAASPKGGAQPPAAANGPEEQAAADLLKEATKAAEEMNYDEAKKHLAELKEKYPQTRAGRAAQRLDSELEVIGKPEADLAVEKWYAGTAADVAGGNATMLVFWEVWCPHCKREVPKLSATYDKFQGKGLRMVGLTKQTRGITDDQVASFIKDNEVSYPIAKEEGDAMSQHYGVRGIPAAAVVKDGKVVWRGHPARVTDEMIEGWIGG